MGLGPGDYFRGVEFRSVVDADLIRQGPALPNLVEHPDDWIAARASAELGLAWMQGQGTRKQSRFAAIEWINRAVALQPADNDIEHIQAEILNSHNRVKTLFTLCGATLFRGTLHASELPPKSGNRREDRLQASA